MRAQRPAAICQHQLRDLAQRLHASGPRELRAEAQRGQWRRHRDGENHNLSWNCGVEGPTDDPAIRALRERQKRNFMATLFLSQGVPMISRGDELSRTQRGNNNAYCQDNEIGWTDWTRRPQRFIFDDLPRLGSR